MVAGFGSVCSEDPMANDFHKQKGCKWEGAAVPILRDHVEPVEIPESFRSLLNFADAAVEHGD